MPVPSGAPTSAVPAGRGRRCLLRCRFRAAGQCPRPVELRLPQAGLPVLRDGRYLLPAGRLLLRAGLVFVRVILPLFPLLRWGPLRGDQLRASWRGGGGPGLGGGVRLPSVSSATSPGLGGGTAGAGSVGAFFGRVGSKAAGDSGRAVCAGGWLALLVSRTRRGRRAGRSAGGAGAWACALSRAARMRCRSESDSTGRVNGPVPGPRFVPGARRGRGGPPLSSATPTPLAACTTARSLQDRGAQNGLPINTNRSTNDQ